MLKFIGPLLDRQHHRRQIKRCTGAACFGALAEHFGTTSSTALERLIDGREKYVTRNLDRSDSNKYLRWRQGKSLPRSDSIALISERSDGRVHLDRWRNLILWELLEPSPIPRERLRTLFHGLPCIAALLAEPDRGVRKRSPVEITINDVWLLRKLRSLDAFQALLCAARSEEWNEGDDEEGHRFLTRSAFYVFPHVLVREPALAYAWEDLFDCLKPIFWSAFYLHSPARSLKKAWVSRQLQRLQAKSHLNE